MCLVLHNNLSRTLSCWADHKNMIGLTESVRGKLVTGPCIITGNTLRCVACALHSCSNRCLGSSGQTCASRWFDCASLLLRISWRPLTSFKLVSQPSQMKVSQRHFARQLALVLSRSPSKFTVDQLARTGKQSQEFGL